MLDLGCGFLFVLYLLECMCVVLGRVGCVGFLFQLFGLVRFVL